MYIFYLRFRPLSSSSGFASLDDSAIRSTMSQNLPNIDDIYKNYGEALKHYSKVSYFNEKNCIIYFTLKTDST